MMGSYVIPLFFLLSIGMAIIYNLGSNFVVGEISYITKALAAVLQLGVTMDYSIFRAGGSRHVEDAIFISALTTAFSFLMLSTTGFKLLESISLVLFFGILISYITGYLIFNNKND